MSKQYLTAHVQEKAHPADIFSFAVTSRYVISASGDSNIKLWDTISPEHTLLHTFVKVHPLGTHHIAVSKDGKIAASSGFDGETLLWDLEQLKRIGSIGGKYPGEVWALSLSTTGSLLASTTYDGRVVLWDALDQGTKLREYETKGSFGMCVEISPDGKLVASGHENGGVYIFNNDTGRIFHSLPGLLKPVRCVAFSPAGKLLAACGDSNFIALYDVASGEQVANLAGHSSWVFSVAWSSTGEYILSGSFDGKAKVWSTETKACVATHSETDKALYVVKWLPKGQTVGEGFLTAGANRRICFYREATGG
ncbi:WD repeat-containing protein-like protein 61 [Morchella snyderi]|nr:WD repeat-containing protein-like protein 61 [Morchella snyderi]